ncbi:MAG: SurA N-terminal domain-containing protein, partial [Bryobacteraceae bacterium]
MGALLACAGLVFAADPRNNANAPDNSDFAVVDQIVAKVNGDIITQTELQKTARDTIAALQQQQQLSGDRLKAAYEEHEKDFLRNRIDQLLLVQRGKELDLNVDSEVSKYLADLQRQEKVADPDKFHDFIRQQTGMSFEDFKQEVKNNMMTRQVIGREVASKISIPESDIQAYYN